MKVLISTGGTGGHIYPALIVGKYFKDNGFEVIFTIGKREREIEILRQSKEKFINLPIGYPTKRIFPFQIFVSLFKSYSILKKEKSNFIFAFGSYASFPILFWSKLLKIPYYLHEQNSIPGKVIKFFSKNAVKVFISFKESENYLNSGNLIFCGMPVREKIGKIDRKDGLKRFNLKDDKKTFLLIGGSGGSKFLLDLIKKHEQEILKLNLQGIIIKGDIKLKEDFKFDCLIFDYINEIEYAFAASDFVISRGGASTIWEILYSKRPAIVVPIKTSEHQNKNSSFIGKLQVGVILKEDEDKKFKDLLSDFMSNLEIYNKNFEKLNFPDTKSIILKEILNAKWWKDSSNWNWWLWYDFTC